MFRRLAAPAAGRRGGEIAGGRRRQTEWEEVEEQFFFFRSKWRSKWGRERTGRGPCGGVGFAFGLGLTRTCCGPAKQRAYRLEKSPFYFVSLNFRLNLFFLPEQ